MPQAYFQNIRPVVLNHLGEARHSVEAAVAWFTDRQIFDLLLDLLQRKVEVTVIMTNDTINQNTSFDWATFGKAGGRAYVYGDDSRTMHHKFCLIDGQTLLSGSYNWTYRAANANRENLMVFLPEDGFDLSFFQQGFQNLLAESTLMTTAPATREEPELLPSTDLIRDHEPDRLKVRIRLLEMETGVLEETKARLEGNIERYLHRLRVEVGDLLNRIAHLKTLVAERIARQTNRRSDVERADKLRQAFEQTRQQVADARTRPPQTPDPDMDAELRKLYYQAAMKAHPDRFLDNTDQHARATAFMAELNQAYSRNDAEAVRQLVTRLEDGLIFQNDLATEPDRDVLQKRLQRLEKRKTGLEQEIASLQAHDACSRDDADTDAYFAQLRAQLVRQVQALEGQLAHI